MRSTIVGVIVMVSLACLPLDLTRAGIPPQGTPIKAHVYDRVTKRPLAGVRVAFFDPKGASLGSSASDSTGEYDFSPLGAYNGTVVYSRDRYKTLRLNFPKDVSDEQPCTVKPVYLSRRW